MTKMTKITKIILFTWILTFVLNLLNYFLSLGFFAKFISILWFLLTILALFYVFKTFKNNLLLKVILFIMAFASGFFTSYLFYGYVDIDSLYFGLIFGIMVVSLIMGVVIIV